MLDPVPFASKSGFREHDPKLDIGPTFRFRPRTNAERVVDFIANRGLSPLQSPEFEGEIKYTHAGNCGRMLRREQKELRASGPRSRNAESCRRMATEGASSANKSFGLLPRQ